MNIPRHSLIAAVAFGALVAPGAYSPIAAQANSQSLGVSAVFQGYDFDNALGIDAAQLVMIPVAYRLPAGERFSAELYSAWAEGRVQRDGQVSVLKGLVDTRLHFSYKASPWAILTASVNLPTGNVTHNSEEAVVASVLSSDILGFRESNWGTGGYLTTGLATAHRAGNWGLGLGLSYRAADEFEPTTDTTLAYSPGNELRVRVGVDRNVGETGKFTAGLTFQSYASDESVGGISSSPETVYVSTLHTRSVRGARRGTCRAPMCGAPRATGACRSWTRAGPSWETPPSRQTRRTSYSSASTVQFPSDRQSTYAPSWTSVFRPSARHPERWT